MMRRVRTLSGVIGRKEMRRRLNKSEVKVHGSTVEKLWILLCLRYRGVNGIPSGVVKYVDIRKNTRGEGDSLAIF